MNIKDWKSENMTKRECGHKFCADASVEIFLTFSSSPPQKIFFAPELLRPGYCPEALRTLPKHGRVNPKLLPLQVSRDFDHVLFDRKFLI